MAEVTLDKRHLFGSRNSIDTLAAPEAPVVRIHNQSQFAIKSWVENYPSLTRNAARDDFDDISGLPTHFDVTSNITMEKDPITDKCALDTAQLLFDACGSNTELALQTLHRHRATDEDDALTEFRQAIQQQLQTLTNASPDYSAIETEKNGFSQNSDAEQKVIDAIAENEVVAENINEVFDDQLSFGDRVADRVASFGGSWTFILTFVGIMVVWIAINTLALINPNVFPSFDPYPFILLNLGLSSLAALQAPIIMMSQNRQSEKDRLKVEQNYAVSLKTDLQIIDMQKKLDDFHMALLDSRKSEL